MKLNLSTVISGVLGGTFGCFLVMATKKASSNFSHKAPVTVVSADPGRPMDPTVLPLGWKFVCGPNDEVAVMAPDGMLYGRTNDMTIKGAADTAWDIRWRGLSSVNGSFDGKFKPCPNLN